MSTIGNSINIPLPTAPKAASVTTNGGVGASASGAGGDSEFADILQDSLGSVRGALFQADKVATQAMVGEAQPHEAMLALTKADLSLRMLTQTRNKMVDAYKEIMNMQM